MQPVLPVPDQELETKKNVSESTSNATRDPESNINKPERKETHNKVVPTEPISSTAGDLKTNIIHAEDMESEKNDVPSENTSNSVRDPDVIKAKDLEPENVVPTESVTNAIEDLKTNIIHVEDMETEKNVVPTESVTNAIEDLKTNIIHVEDMETEKNVVPSKTTLNSIKDPEAKKNESDENVVPSESTSNSVRDLEVIKAKDLVYVENVVPTEPFTNAVGDLKTNIIHAEENVVPSESTLISTGDPELVQVKDLESQENVVAPEPASNTAADPETNMIKAKNPQTQKNVVSSDLSSDGAGVSELNTIKAGDLKIQENVVPSESALNAAKDIKTNIIKAGDLPTQKNAFASEPPSNVADVVAPANAAGDFESNIIKASGDLKTKENVVLPDPPLNAAGELETNMVEAKSLQSEENVTASGPPLNAVDIVAPANATKVSESVIIEAKNLETQENVLPSKSSLNAAGHQETEDLQSQKNVTQSEPASNVFGDPEITKPEDVETQEHVAPSSSVTENSEPGVINAESGQKNDINVTQSKTADNSDNVVLIDSENDVDTDLDSDDEILPPAPKKMKLTMAVKYGSASKSIDHLEFKSLPKVMQFMFRLFELDMSLSLQENRNIIRAKRKHIYDKVISKAKNIKTSMKKACRTIHIEQLPNSFNYLHVKDLIQIFSNFDVNSDNCMIDTFKSGKFNESVIRFMEREDCLQVFADLQKIFIYGIPIKARLDFGDKMFKTRLALPVVRNRYRAMVAKCKQESQGRKQLHILQKKNIKVEDTPVQSEKSVDNIETSAEDVAKQTKIVEDEPMEIETGIDETSSQISKESGKNKVYEGDNEDVVVLITNLIDGKQEMLHRLIKQQVGKHTNYVYRYLLEIPDKKFTGKVMLKFIDPEDAKLAQEKLNGVVVGGRALEATLHKGEALKSFLYHKLRKQLISKQQQPTSTDVDLAVSYLPPMVNDNYMFGIKSAFIKKLGLTPPFHPTIHVYKLHLEVNEAKLREVFSLAGEVIRVDMCIGKKGLQAIIEFDHPLEAVQAISLFNGHELYGRVMEVVMFRDERERLLPLGLSSIGQGLGENGLPLRGIRTKVETKHICRMLYNIGILKRELDTDTAFSHTFTADTADPPNSNSLNTAKPSDINSSNTALPSDISSSNTSKPSTNSLNTNKTENPQSTNTEIEALGKALLSSGLIPAGTDCKNVQSIMSALQNKAAALVGTSTVSNPNENKNYTSEQVKNKPPLGPKSPNLGTRWSNSNMAGPRGTKPDIPPVYHLKRPHQNMGGPRGPYQNMARPRGPNPNMAGPRGPNPNMAGPRGPNPNMAGPRGPNPHTAVFGRFDNQNNPNIQPNFNQNESDAVNQAMNQLMLYMSSNAALTPNMMQPNVAQAMQAYMAQYNMMQPNLANNPMMGQNNFGAMPNVNQALGMVEQQAAYGNQSRWDVSSMPPNPVAHAAMAATPAVISAPAIITAPPVVAAPPMAMNMPQSNPQPSPKESSSKDEEPDIKKGDTLMFRYLPPSVTSEALARKMREIGELMLCELTGKDRAVVRFKNPSSADKCHRLFHNSKVDGQVIEVQII